MKVVLSTRWLTAAFILLHLMTSVTCYPDGAPETACVDMMPGVINGVVGLEGHLNQPQNILPTYGNQKSPPYYILTSVSQYNPGQEITINIVANQTAGMKMYKGLLLQARRVICASDLGRENETIMVEDVPVGFFRPISGDKLLKTITCAGATDSALSHRSPQFKINETATWVAPSTGAGHVIFKATVVQESYIYWTNLHSKVIVDPTDPEPQPRTCASSRIMAQQTLMTSLFIVLVYVNQV